MITTSLDAAPPLQIRGLVKRFPGADALGGVSFDVRSGEILGLLGPNGAGKTTTLHTCLGLITPSEGSIRVFGLDPHAQRSRAMRRVAFASPEALMDWRLTIRENLRVYSHLYGADAAAVDRWLTRFDLADMQHSPFGDLSLGQQTRAGLARAMLGEPDLLVLDEPTSSLDPDIADRTRQLLLEIRSERNLSLLYTSHNMAEVEEMCDRVVFLHLGRIVAEGTPLEISRKVLAADNLDSASLNEVFLKIAREGIA